MYHSRATSPWATPPPKCVVTLHEYNCPGLASAFHLPCTWSVEGTWRGDKKLQLWWSLVVDQKNWLAQSCPAHPLLVYSQQYIDMMMRKFFFVPSFGILWVEDLEQNRLQSTIIMVIENCGFSSDLTPLMQACWDKMCLRTLLSLVLQCLETR